jgi:hypothetical protein
MHMQWVLRVDKSYARAVGLAIEWLVDATWSSWWVRRCNVMAHDDLDGMTIYRQLVGMVTVISRDLASGCWSMYFLYPYKKDILARVV